MKWLFYVASCRLIFRHRFVGESKDLGNIRGTRISKVCLSPSAGVVETHETHSTLASRELASTSEKYSVVLSTQHVVIFFNSVKMKDCLKTN